MSDFTQEERDAIEKEFEKILDLSPKSKKSEDSRIQIRKAFDLAVKAHDGMRRRSGEPYIVHPIEVTKIVAGEIGLGTKSIICSLLHDVVEDTEYTLEDIGNIFDEKVVYIIDGLTKIGGVLKNKKGQAENFRKVLMTLSDDVRVILIKMADRLHNMRTMDSMPLEKQLRISAETKLLFAPLAHRLGLYSIKTELEDLCLKYEHPDFYNEITRKLVETEQKRQHYLNRFCIPLMIKIESEGVDYSINGRPKSVASIYNKMKNKNVQFEGIYDLLAVRIVLNDVPQESEKTMCWKIYSLITDLYQPNPDRLRDWISTPKDNGYEALHTTVMGPEGRWVEVQVRTKRMDDIAERGYAAHWKYKDPEHNTENQLDIWMKRLREMLENPYIDPVEFLDDFKLNLYNEEIFIFTPKGDLKRLPTGATVLDMAYEIHTDVGNHAIGAKINKHKTVPLDYKLASGDQVEILTSDKQIPQKDWLDFVVTAKAKNQLKTNFKFLKKKQTKQGKIIIDTKLKELKIEPEEKIYRRLFRGYKLNNKIELFLNAGREKLDYNDFEKFAKQKRENKILKYWRLQLNRPTIKPSFDEEYDSKQTVILKPEDQYDLANCCKPIPGDNIIAFKNKYNSIIIHKHNCEKGILLQKDPNFETIRINWIKQRERAFLVRINLIANDRVGLLNNITEVISSQLNINMRTLHFDTVNRKMQGTIDLYIHNNSHLNDLMVKLKAIKGMQEVVRVEKFD
jgi:GTP diphosphokinase / guanosine-3',5'-bis(diphosphate) 3'-diphosphatase